jgi:hypothetical protein
MMDLAPTTLDAMNPAPLSVEGLALLLDSIRDVEDPEHDVPPPLLDPEEDAVNVTDDINVAALYSDALRTSAETVRDYRQAEDAKIKELATWSSVIQEKLLAKLKSRLPEVVMTAAKTGARTATLLEFQGADVYCGYCYLHLILGARPGPQVRQLARHGFQPLIYRLRQEFRPFNVMHRWDRATNKNTIEVSWQSYPTLRNAMH